jgi:hypothetical protein
MQPAPEYWQRMFKQSARIALEERGLGSISAARFWARHARADFAAWKSGQPRPARAVN